jgi:DNA-binding protein HU-beta
LNKSELVQAVSTKASVDRQSAEEVLSAFFDTVSSETKGGDKVAWPGFGSFRTVQRSARMGRTSPSDPTPKRIAASTAIKFTPSAALKDFMNAKGRAGGTKKTGARSSAKATKATKKGTAKKTTKRAGARR